MLHVDAGVTEPFAACSHSTTPHLHAAVFPAPSDDHVTINISDGSDHHVCARVDVDAGHLLPVLLHGSEHGVAPGLRFLRGADKRLFMVRHITHLDARPVDGASLNDLTDRVALYAGINGMGMRQVYEQQHVAGLELAFHTDDDGATYPHPESPRTPAES